LQVVVIDSVVALGTDIEGEDPGAVLGTTFVA